MSNADAMGAERFSLAALIEARIQCRRERGNRLLRIDFIPESYPLVSDDWMQQVRYWMMRIDGQSHNMAEMLATRSFPGFVTDAIYNQGRCNGNQFEKCPAVGDYYRRVAEAAGVNTTGKYYSRMLADFPGDPEAWVSDRHDVLRVCKERNFRAHGLASYEPHEVEPMPDVEVASDLVEEEIARRLSFAPGSSREDVFDSTYSELAGQVNLTPEWQPSGPDISEAFGDE